MKLRDEVKKKIVKMTKGYWAYQYHNKMTDDAVALINEAMKSGKIKFVDDEVITSASYKVIDTYY